MERTKNKTKETLGAVIRILMALVLALGMMPGLRTAAWAAPEGNDTSTAYVEGDGAAGDEVRAALAENADASLVGEALPEKAGPVVSVLQALGLADAPARDGLADTGQTLLVKYTIADSTMVAEGDTIDSLFASEEGQFAIAGQYAASAPLYEIDPEAGYYAAFIDSPEFNGAATIQDHEFAMNNAHGEVIDDAVYDAEAGIAYIPKGYLDDVDGITPVQLQVLASVDIASAAEADSRVAVKVDGGGVVDVPEDVSVREGALDMSTTIPVATPDTAPDIDLTDISVTLNGADDPVALDEDVAAYDAETGLLTLSVSPMSVASVDVRVERGFALAERAYAKVSTTGDWFLKNSKGNKITLKHLDLESLSVGDVFKAKKQRIGYIGKGVQKDADIVAATESYLYSWSLYPEKLYTKIKEGNGNWSSYNVEPTKNDNGDIIDSNSLEVATGMDWVTHTIPVPSGKVGGQNWKGFGSLNGLALTCGHVSDPIDSLANTNEDVYGQVWWRVLAMSTTGDNPYIILGFICGDIVGQAGVGIYKVALEPNGKLELEKKSANTAVTDGNPLYSLEGAVYGVYDSTADAASDNDREETLTVKASGKSNKVTLPAADYYVKELVAPSGYVLDTEIHKVTVTAGETTTFEAKDEPQMDPAEIQKQDQQTGSTPQGSASFDGMQYTFKFYAGAYYTAANLPATPTRTWVLKADSSGYANLQSGASLKVSGDDFYYRSTGEVACPLGTLAITETKAPTGYQLGYYDNSGTFHAPETVVYQVKPNPDGSVFALLDLVSGSKTSTGAAKGTDAVIRGNLEGVKADSKTRDGKAQGKATLEGATLEVVSKNRNPVVSPQTGQVVNYGGVVCTLKTAADGTYSTTRSDLNGWSIPAAFGGCALAIGDYEVHEAVAPEGYLLNENWSETFTVSDQGQVVKKDFTDDVKRGDFDFYKVAGDEQRPLANIPFVITSKATGESHVAVTDANGYFSSVNSFNAHTANTNGNDVAVSLATDEDGEPCYIADESKLDATAGIWFTGHDNDKGAPVDDTLGAFPYDEYTLEEVRCSANEGYELIKNGSLTIERHNYKVGPVTYNDNKPITPSIGTTLTDDNGTDSVPGDGQYLLTDKVGFANFDEGTYLFKGELHAVDADGVDQGVIATTNKYATITFANGDVDMGFVIDTSLYAGKGYRLVATEQCLTSTGELYAEHNDLTDEFQTVFIPEIKTTLTDTADGDHEAPSCGTVTLTDAVAYEGLTPQKQYTVTMTLHKKDADGNDAGVLLDKSGQPVTATQRFFPTDRNGTVDVSVAFEPDGGGYDVVAFEEVKYKDVVYAVHADISDESQTVHLPGIATTATDPTTGQHVAALGSSKSIVDTVTYTDLEAEVDYTLTGAVHVRAADGTDAGTLKDASGKEVTASAQFTPAAPNGTVEMRFDFDADVAPGTTLVVFEQLVRDDNSTLTAEHADISDEDQAVRIGKAVTTAIDKQTSSHFARSTAEFTVTDTVTYSNLAPDVEYVVHGTLNVPVDSGSGVLSDGSGRDLESTITFLAGSENGNVSLDIAADPDYIEGSKVVVFEEIGVKVGDQVVWVAEHKDIDDDDQAIWVPTITTQAHDKMTGTNEGDAATSATVVDTTKYTGLEKGAAYKLVATLMDKATGQEFLDDGQKVTSEKAFTAKKSNGKQNIELEIKNTVLDGRELVVFERLYDASGNVVAVHEDIDAEEQTVYYHAPGLPDLLRQSGDLFDKTGYWLAEYWWVILAAAVGLLLVGAIRYMANDGESVFNDEEDAAGAE